MSESRLHHGGCLCGGVRYRVTGPLRAPLACHCGQCRRQSGHHVVATQAKKSDLILERAETLAWFESSPGIKRGFCSRCGSLLFWQREADERVAIMVGGLDQPTGLKLAGHIFIADKGDYYELPDDGLPRLDGSSEGALDHSRSSG